MDNLEKNSSIVIRLNASLKDAFLDVARKNNRNASILVRDFMADYIKKNGQMSFFDDQKKGK